MAGVSMISAPGQYRFDRIITAVLSVGLAAHLVYIPFFALVGLPVLAWVGLLSIPFWIGSLIMSLRGQSSAAFSMVTVTHVLVIVFTVSYLGWGRGFESLLIPTAALACWNPYWTLRQRRRVMYFIAALFIVMAMMQLGGTEPRVRVSDGLRQLVYTGNMIILFVVVGVMVTFASSAAERVDRRFRRLANTDMLTGLENRYSMTNRLEAAASRHSSDSFALILCDIDRFKRINDVWGHDRGDQVLQHVAGVLRKSLQGADAVARWGGEEFLILLPGSDLETARATAARISSALAASPLSGDEAWPRTTFTYGMAERKRGEQWQETVRRADRALMKGKRAGRNQMVAAD